MPTAQFDKIFTPSEANELIPRLEVAVRQLQARAGELRQRIAELVNLHPEARQFSLPQLIERYPQLRELANGLAQAAEKIESYGCLLKDIDQGLIDFPWEIEDGQVVFLCWQFGEPAVLAWHPIDAGFAQRQPLSGAPKRYLN
ncbi:MAG TPA: DUF2203 domain-containing protein [Candidatus Binataceae bacterium]|nr:DUF2203 domain-containing protein [Candidatus Binataceae bacterium]